MTENSIIEVVKENGAILKANISYYCNGDRCNLVLSFDGRVHSSDQRDLFHCFCDVRKQIYPLVPACKGAERNVFPSSMSQQMSHGKMAYELILGKPSQRNNVVDIFSPGNIDNLCSVEEQLSYYESWKDSLTYYNPDNFSIRIKKDILNKFEGSLLGLACGDALGTTLEFQKPGTFEPIKDIIGGGPFNLLPGQWTDDTSMALCLASSLIKKEAFNPYDQMETYVEWYKNGYLSSTGSCFDIGNTIKQALERFLYTREAFSGSSDKYSAGNGALMRIAPVPLFFFKHPLLAINKAGESSRTTHGAEESIQSCRFYTGLILAALQGLSKDVILSADYFQNNIGSSLIKSPKILDISNGSYKQKSPPDIVGSGYVINSMEAALWAFYHGDNFEDGCLLAANLGDDADTTAAIYGQLAGAYYGKDNIPKRWTEKIFFKKIIESHALALYKISHSGISNDFKQPIVNIVS